MEVKSALLFSEGYQPILNGVTTYIDNLIDGLRASGRVVNLVTADHPKHHSDEQMVYRLPASKRLSREYPCAINALSYFEEVIKLPADVVHSQHPFFVGQLAQKVALEKSVAHISTFHTLYDQYAHYTHLPKKAVKVLLKLWLPWFYNTCQCVIAPSRFAAEVLENYNVRTDIVVIPSGMREADLSLRSKMNRDAVRNKLGLSSSSRLLLSVGRLAPEKNVQLVVKSFAKICKEFSECYLIIIGAGPSQKKLIELITELKLGNRVIFAGAKPLAEVAKYYGAGDLLVLGSSKETQGLVVLEAASYGVPALVSNVGGAKESVDSENTGIIGSPSVEEFASHLNRLLSCSNTLRDMSEACLANAPKHTIESMIKKTLGVYSLYQT